MNHGLIINADDFGLTEGVNRAIAELHQAGAISSTTLMANSRAFDHAVRVALAHPRLAVGCHIVLTRGTPVAEARQVSSLLGPDGRFPKTLLQLVVGVYRGRIVEAEIEIEAIAQIRRLQQAGIQVSHIDTHKHTHLFPRIARPLMRAAATCGVKAIRNPFEPDWSARFSRGRLTRLLEGLVMPQMRKQFERACGTLDLQTNDGCIAISSLARLDDESLQALLAVKPPGTWELICHPGYNDADLAATHTRMLATREVERMTLLNQIPAAVRMGALRLIDFRELDRDWVTA